MRVGNDEIILCMPTVEECQGSSGVISITSCAALTSVLVFSSFFSISIQSFVYYKVYRKHIEKYIEKIMTLSFYVYVGLDYRILKSS